VITSLPLEGENRDEEDEEEARRDTGLAGARGGGVRGGPHRSSTSVASFK
jgi:hypothetical protein